jgi:hypothetical protein
MTAVRRGGAKLADAAPSPLASSSPGRPLPRGDSTGAPLLLEERALGSADT